MGRLFSGIGIRILIIAVIAGGAFILRDRISGSASDLKVGDCFDLVAASTIEDVQHHPCTESHNAEVVLVTNHSAAKGTPYLSDNDLDTYIETTCGTAVATYVGTGVDLDTLNWGLFYPAQEDWDKGERKMACYVTDLNKAPLTKSLKAVTQ